MRLPITCTHFSLPDDKDREVLNSFSALEHFNRIEAGRLPPSLLRQEHICHILQHMSVIECTMLWGEIMTNKTMQSRKQQVVRDAIYDAAIELFAVKGFDGTTVDDVAEAAGISQRSFFRYFASKDDLLAESVVKVGTVLAEAVAACPANFTTLQVMREAVLSALNYSASHQQIRQVVEIATRSPSARQAYMSRMIHVEDKLADALAVRMKGASGSSLRPRMLAGTTLSIMSASVSSWFQGDFKDLNTAGKKAFAEFTRCVSEKES